jgi:hypothetical protein
MWDWLGPFILHTRQLLVIEPSLHKKYILLHHSPSLCAFALPCMSDFSNTSSTELLIAAAADPAHHSQQQFDQIPSKDHLLRPCMDVQPPVQLLQIGQSLV